MFVKHICLDLRSREDTVRCIVSSLTDDGSSELSDELFKGQPLVLDESYHSDDDAEDWENWMPDPVDADPGMLLNDLKYNNTLDFFCL